MQNEIERALKQFEKETRSKRGFLLTKTGCYFAYDNKFCSLHDFDIRLESASYAVSGSRIERPLWISAVEQEAVSVVTDEQQIMADRLRLLFHIACGDTPDEMLRGILFVKCGITRFALFADAAIEELFLALEAETYPNEGIAAPDQALCALVERENQKSLRLLTELYLRGRNGKELRDYEKNDEGSTVFGFDVADGAAGRLWRD